MKIVVHPHTMELGGSQLNAVELAGQYARSGHEVILFCGPGALVPVAEARGLRIEQIPPSRKSPSPGTVRQLRRLIRAERVDAIHAFEWPPILQAWAAAGSTRGTAVLGTIMSMSVPPLIPRDVPLTLGTLDILDSARSLGFRDASLLEPPIDTELNSPDVLVDPHIDVLGPRDRGILEVVAVSRLVPDMKGRGLIEAVAAMRQVPRSRLIIVGDGSLRADLQRRAEEVNADLGREVISVVGPLSDPRPAYQRADVVLGMGGSALRGLAFAKPLVVAGEAGYWQLLTPQAAAGYSRTGWFGVGDGTSGVDRLAGILNRLLADAHWRDELGDFGRRWVVDHYGLPNAAQACVATMSRLASEAPSVRRVSAQQAAISAGRLLVYKVGRKVARRRGTARTDDFNAVKVPQATGRSSERTPDERSNG